MMTITAHLGRPLVARTVLALAAAAAIAAASYAATERNERPEPFAADTLGRPAVTLVTGRPVLVDGDTLDLAGRRIRLEGIDAPERAQTCSRGPIGDRFAAGSRATAMLEELIAGREIACRIEGRDGFGRDIATCFAGDTNLNAEMVSRGAAWAFLKYSKTYQREEAAARDLGIGVWSANCMRAEHFRSERWQRNAAAAPEGCPIKGNISRTGRVYHMPWSAWYDRTSIDESRGERWFCSEDEAIRAGWRPATG